MKNFFLSLLLTLFKESSTNVKAGDREKTTFKKEIINVAIRIEAVLLVTPRALKLKADSKTLLPIRSEKLMQLSLFYRLSEREAHRECTSNSGFT